MTTTSIQPDLSKPTDLQKGLLNGFTVMFCARNSTLQSLGTFYLARFTCSAHYTLLLKSTTGVSAWVAFNREFDLLGADVTQKYRVYQDVEDLTIWCFPIYNDPKHSAYQTIWRREPGGTLMDFGAAIWVNTDIPL